MQHRIKVTHCVAHPLPCRSLQSQRGGQQGYISLLRGRNCYGCTAPYTGAHCCAELQGRMRHREGGRGVTFSKDCLSSSVKPADFRLPLALWMSIGSRAQFKSPVSTTCFFSRSLER
jgi:hypothetical protein